MCNCFISYKNTHFLTQVNIRERASQKKSERENESKSKEVKTDKTLIALRRALKC